MPKIITHLDALYPVGVAPLFDAYIIFQSPDEGGEILEMGEGVPPHIAEAETHDMSGCVGIPGLINTHHHLFQTLTRGLATNHGLFDWLDVLYPIWVGIDAEALYQSALIGMAELLRSGCTTTADHLYFVPEGQSPHLFFDGLIEAAQKMGIRLLINRGSMTYGYDQGGRGPQELIEREDDVVTHMEFLASHVHDPSPLAMIKVGLAPVSFPSVTARMMKMAAHLAEQYGVSLHTHGWETRQEHDWVMEHYQRLAVDLFDEWGWLTPKTWFAHGVHMSPSDILRVSQNGAAVAHCPTSNMRLGSGIAPVPFMRGAGMPVSLGVDGSASNDSGHLLAEARQALLLARAAFGPDALSLTDVLNMATESGARVLNWSGIGRLRPGLAADIAIYRLDDLEHSGASHDPLAALILCAPAHADTVIVNGCMRVRDGQVLGFDTPLEVARHQTTSKRLLQRVGLMG